MNVNDEIEILFQSPSLRGSGRFLLDWFLGSNSVWGFNPLHCGAVVASTRRSADRFGRSLFQSPSLRGSSRFNVTCTHRPTITQPSFNPLHCGAVVASSCFVVG